MSLIELEVAEKVTNCARVVFAMIRASVVFPDPGGPQKIIDGMRSVSIALRRKRPEASSSLRPTTSSSVFGRTRSGSGASFDVPGSGGVVSKRVMGRRIQNAERRMKNRELRWRFAHVLFLNSSFCVLRSEF